MFLYEKADIFYSQILNSHIRIWLVQSAFSTREFPFFNSFVGVGERNKMSMKNVLYVL